MNKHLVDFFEEQLKENEYLENIRRFQKDKNLTDREVLTDIVDGYDDNMDYIGPYKFLDGIENYLTANYDYCIDCLNIDAIIESAFVDGYMD